MNDERLNNARRTGPQKPPGGISVPPPQHNLQIAVEKAVKKLADQSAEQLEWLGATPQGEHWRLVVLDEPMQIDLSSGGVVTSSGREVSPKWRILVLHYLHVKDRPPQRPCEVTFADLPSGRVYASVYANRVNRRLCATSGRDLETFRAAAESLGAERVCGGDAAYEFSVFPRLAVRIIWHGPDDEFPPSATVLLGDNVESYLCTEDIVVMSEALVSRLSGRPF